MSFSNKFLSGAAVAALSMSFAGMAQADACDTPSKLGDLGNFAGEVITIAGSMEGKDEEMLLNTVSCFEKATGAVVQYSGSRDFGFGGCRFALQQRAKYCDFPAAGSGRGYGQRRPLGAAW